MKVYCATGNKGKLREFQLAGKLPGIDIEPLAGLQSISPPEENGTTFEENAKLKARYYSRFAPELVFADDSGLEVDSLDGEPGVYSARFAGPDATDVANNRLLLDRLGKKPDRRARFICVIALAQRGEVLQTFRGEVEGEILREARGPGGFGYDPLFYYLPLGSSFGEIDDARKFGVSHRGNALRQMLKYLVEVHN